MSQQTCSKFALAVKNITTFGDTDVLPFPFETLIFFDRPDQVTDDLERLYNAQDIVKTSSIFHESLLATAGYSGLRRVTQIDPFWNAFYFGLVLSVAQDIEAVRLPIEEESVFSYRFEVDKKTNKLFRTEFDFRSFEAACLRKASEAKYVVACDISDFYSRIYHHRLENALRRCTTKQKNSDLIVDFLKSLSKGTSYGLPVGGPASRILSELVLNNVDRLLHAARIPFCRYCDDYRLFANSLSDAYSHLIFLSEKLLDNEGLTLQKHKTRIMSSSEFERTTELADEDSTEMATMKRSFLNLRLFYDQYSPTAESDYEALREELEPFDVLAMLRSETSKSRVHQPLAKRLVQSIAFLSPDAKIGAVRTILQHLETLYPLLNTVLIALKDMAKDEDFAARSAIFAKIREGVDKESFIYGPSCNLAFAVRVLGYDPSIEADATLSSIYRRTNLSCIRRDVILALARKRSHPMLSDLMKSYDSSGPWEKRAFILASYVMGDEGTYWREGRSKRFDETEIIVRDWAASKKVSKGWDVPL
jgi:hypothetical protein